jgi:hypothetical protein
MTVRHTFNAKQIIVSKGKNKISNHVNKKITQEKHKKQNLRYQDRKKSGQVESKMIRRSAKNKLSRA